MLFFFKPKTINIDCFTTRQEIFNLFPIDYSHKFYPEWWKKLPKTLEDDGITTGSTMKKCVGFNQFFQNSLTIPLWCDFSLRIYPEDGRYDVKFSDGKSEFGYHPYTQMEGLVAKETFIHLKLISPWAFNCKDDINWSWIQHTWNFSPIDKCIIPPASVDYKYQNGTNINLFAKSIRQDIIFESGQAMVNITPLTERKLKIHNHLVDHKEYEKKVWSSVPLKFDGKYNSVKEIMKKKEKESKCPFGFK
jgi:hypothetical protein